MGSVMIGSIVAALWTPIVTTLWTPMVDQMKYLPKIGGNMRKLKKDSKELEGIRDVVEDKIKTATERANDMEKTKQVVKWLEKVQTMKDDVNKIEQDHTKLQKMCLGDFPLNCWSGYKISKRAANTAKDVKELIKETDKMDVLTNKMVPNVQRKLDRADLLPTVEVNLEDAIKHLQDDMTSMVGIWGMGGVGKTTLLTKINNHPYVANAGFLVIWVDVSKELSLHNLQSGIAERINLDLEGDSTVDRATSLSNCLQNNSIVESRAASLSHFLQNKKILLLLDDLWEKFDLQKLGIPCHNVPNCKVVFTSRDGKKCDEMMAEQKFPAHFELKKIKLQCLEEEDAWELFKSNIGKTALDFISSDERVERHAKRVAQKCSGLPLTLVPIAKSMSSNNEWDEWQDAFNSINSIQELLGEEAAAPLFQILKVSYDRLGDERLRKCFLTCALWPEDYRIRKDELIWSWLGLDLVAVREFDDINAAFSRGHTIIIKLERAGLLLDAGEEGEEVYPLPYLAQYVKLHDIIREMALWIAKDYGKNSNKATEAAEEEQKWSEVEMAFTLRLPHKSSCPNQTALMLRGRLFGSPITILYSFFQNMGALTYLALAYSGLREVPSEITELSHLQYLNLAGNEIVQLPKELSHLKKLKYLILGRTEHIPRGLLSGLEKLEVLDLFHSGYTKWGMEGEASIEELAGGTMAPGVNNLKGLGKVKQVLKNWLGWGMEGEASIEELAGGTMAPGVNKLKGLGIAVANMSALKLLTQILYPSKISDRPIKLWKLCIRFLRGVEILDLSKTLLCSNGALGSLQSLSIEFGDMKEILMTSEEKRQLEKLSLFMLRDLGELTKITWKGGIKRGELFANLSEVQFIKCFKLCDVTWIAQLRHLQILVISRCRMLEKVLSDGANQEKDHDDDDDAGVEQEERRATTVILPKLRHLTLDDLPNLKSFCSPEIRFPKLKPNCVKIQDCPQLDKTPFGEFDDEEVEIGPTLD